MPSTSLSHHQAQIIARLLVRLGLGTLAGAGGAWPVYYRREPPTPDEVITVYGTPGGRGGGRVMISGEYLGYYGFQVRVRSQNPSDGYLKADEIATTLAEGCYQEYVEIDGVDYFIHCVTGIGDVMDLNKETPTSKRNIFTLNASASIERV